MKAEQEKKSFFFAGRRVVQNENSVLHDLSTRVMVNHVQKGLNAVISDHLDFGACAGADNVMPVPPNLRDKDEEEI